MAVFNPDDVTWNIPWKALKPGAEIVSGGAAIDRVGTAKDDMVGVLLGSPDLFCSALYVVALKFLSPSRLERTITAVRRFAGFQSRH